MSSKQAVIARGRIKSESEDYTMFRTSQSFGFLICLLVNLVGLYQNLARQGRLPARSLSSAKFDQWLQSSVISRGHHIGILQTQKVVINNSKVLSRVKFDSQIKDDTNRQLELDKEKDSLPK